MRSQSKTPSAARLGSTQSPSQAMPPLDVDNVKERLHAALDDAIAFCQSDSDA